MSKRVATIGFFDGVHLGHQYLIRRLREVADTIDAESVIVTMYPHPRAVLEPGFQPKLLTSINEKLDLLQKTGVDAVRVLEFNLKMRRLSARDFMANVLHDKLGIDMLLMGYDHKFGYGGGTMEEYVAWGKSLGMDVRQIPALPDCCVSSSAIRRLLEEGEVDKAALLLGRPYELCGTVVNGFKVGHVLGFPTANVEPLPEKLLPACGVYAVWAVLPSGESYKGMLNIGHRPTLDNGDGVSVEVHLLGFDGGLYGSSLSLLFVKRLRNEVRFGSLVELQKQLGQDALTVDALLG